MNLRFFRREPWMVMEKRNVHMAEFETMVLCTRCTATSIFSSSLSPSPTSMAATRAPNELWLNIFSYLHPDAHTLLEIASTNRLFCILARSHLFAKFQFHPYISDDNDRTRLPKPHVVERAIERLNFWASGVIAPLVECEITPWKSPTRQRSTKSASTENTQMLTCLFFEKLARLTSVQILSIQDVQFTRNRVVPDMSVVDAAESMHCQLSDSPRAGHQCLFADAPCRLQF
ncbi:hypothetical protein C8R43DRAFT_114185 [Mycena crocata]|nr:hypothetical protein C8R43DRAFT_114185 [Mycena crocata]